MSKRLLFAGALAAFATISGLPSLFTHFVNKGSHSVLHASSNSLEKRQNQSALKNPTVYAENNARPLVSQASFATLHAGSPKASNNRRDNATALQNENVVNQEGIDLGEIHIDDIK